MKYGVIVYKESNNIGDDIQSYAAAQLLPQVDYYIEREHLDIFRPIEEEPVNVIMNGWFMYNKLGWPISSCINPLYISMHFVENDILDIGNHFLTGIGSEDLRRHQPIGCRDIETQKLLNSVGIDTWFSGCITLTLQPNYPQKKEEYICLTDVPQSVVDFIKQRYPQNKIQIIKHVDEEIAMQEMSWEERFNRVKELLSVYQNAKVVITTRLHCAMPCLALETPVLLLTEKEIEEQGRFEGLYCLTHHTSVDEFIKGCVDYDLCNPPKNPEKYIAVRDKIIDKVNEFIDKNKVCTPELANRYALYDSEWEKRALWKDDQFSWLIRHTMKEFAKRKEYLENLQKGKDWLEGQYYSLREENTKIKDELVSCENDNLELSERVKNLLLENAELRQTSVKLQKQTEILKLDVQGLKQKKNELENEVIEKDILNTTLKRKNVTLKEINEECKKQNDIYYNMILDIKRSLTWRIGCVITAIPRKIIDMLKQVN